MKKINKDFIGYLFLFSICFSSVLDLHIFYNSVSSLIRVLVIYFIFGLGFIKYSERKDRMKIIIYFVIVLLYSCLHLFNIKYEIIKEILYIIKMMCSLMVFYSVYWLKIDYKKSIIFIKYILWFICGSIIFCNLFKIGYSSYSFNGIKYNIFDWFMNVDGYFEDFSNKGFFHLANQIVGVVLLFYPLLINEVKNKYKVCDIILLNLCSLSMLIVGNRAASVGPLLILIASFIYYFVVSLFNKHKISLRFVFILLGSMIFISILLFNAPINSRKKFYDTMVINDNFDGVLLDVDDDIILDTRDILLNKYLNNNFIDNYYPYNDDKEFWDNLVNLDIKFEDSRLIEELIVRRVIEINSIKNVSLLGAGYYRIIDVCNIEKDYVMHYYSIGIFGIVILIGIYFVILFKSILKIIFNLDNKFNYLNGMLVLGVSIDLVLCYFSGNMLNALSSIIPLSFVLGLLYNEVNRDKSSRVLGYNICKYDSDEIIDKINNDDKLNIIFNINPIIMVNFYNRKQYKKIINREKYNIADGYGTIQGLRIKGNKDYNQITGIDMFYKLIDNACINNKSIYLYGTKKDILEKCVSNLKNNYKNINICGYCDGYSDVKYVLSDIKKCKPDYLFVALGSPKQEEFIIDNLSLLNKLDVIMPVGGTFDVVSGCKERAPLVYQRLHLEWLYRMIKEPKRVKDNVKIIKYLYLLIFKNND